MRSSWLVGTLATWLIQVPQIAAYGIFWISNGPIIRYESTLTVPMAPLAIPGGPLHSSIWPGIEPTDQKTVLQNVIADGSGNWSFWPEFCCVPDARLQEPQNVYPGDKITTIFTKALDTGIWTDSVILTRGKIGIASGFPPFSGSFVFDPSGYGNNTNFTTALVDVEIHNSGPWNYGKVHFENIVIESLSTDPDWCDNPFIDTHNTRWDIATPTVVLDLDKGTTACCVAGVDMNGP